nr:hypothetical protein [Nitrosomonas sp.]
MIGITGNLRKGSLNAALLRITTLATGVQLRLIPAATKCSFLKDQLASGSF